ncbi:hypothetical protein SAMN05216388_100878 [Halorientalis persicus]|jgi:predicted nucleic acid-binding protein|uniref:Ribonuclease VapC n=1 Tax=Halorientalis persicus TaxID=1367881 RepID=A0A1H8M0I1_9EURY|nr:PIN domain-containing protein [Halorientalis persicus]SEO10914.1 hypothetical protein SAMN05216388_100878 [Halorientalis persicus]
MILDTNYLVDLFSGDRNAHRKARKLKRNHEIQRIPTPVLAELEYGAEFTLSDAERQRIENLSRMYSIAKLDAEMAKRAGRLFAQADRASDGDSGADMVDAMVAALADVTGEAVVTDNRSDFEELGVSVETF